MDLLTFAKKYNLFKKNRNPIVNISEKYITERHLRNSGL